MAKIVNSRCILAVRELGDHSYFAYWNVEGVDEFHREVTARGALVTSAPTDKPWGLREFFLRTPDGHRITCGELIQPVNQRTLKRSCPRGEVAHPPLESPGQGTFAIHSTWRPRPRRRTGAHTVPLAPHFQAGDVGAARAGGLRLRRGPWGYDGHVPGHCRGSGQRFPKTGGPWCPMEGIGLRARRRPLPVRMASTTG